MAKGKRLRYAEFEELCRHHWETAGGDLTALTLPGRDLAELAGDVFSRLPRPKFANEAGEEVPPPAGAAGVSLDRAQNPATGSAVTFTCDPGGETGMAVATVRYGYRGDRFTDF